MNVVLNGTLFSTVLHPPSVSVTVTLQQLYKLKTAKVFDRSKCRSPDSEDDPFAIQHINLCEETRLLLVAGHTHLMLFKYSKSDSSIDVTVSTASRCFMTLLHDFALSYMTSYLLSVDQCV